MSAVNLLVLFVSVKAAFTLKEHVLGFGNLRFVFESRKFQYEILIRLYFQNTIVALCGFFAIHGHHVGSICALGI